MITFNMAKPIILQQLKKNNAKCLVVRIETNENEEEIKVDFFNEDIVEQYDNLYNRYTNLIDNKNGK